MGVRAIVDTYEYPSRSAQENYGDDLLVHVWWQDNLWFCSAGCFRVPQAMAWGDFLSGVVYPWASGDPDFDPATVHDWVLDDAPLEASEGKTLAELGVGHKSLLEFRAPSRTGREALVG
ncbi:MAG: phenol hydroxylase subunit P4 [Actinomycetia bacterium]|jgi:phenol hydroxylase P4 protein|nr:phenol hydroxylase subunit P4 [Actinomycetes bacterium]